MGTGTVSAAAITASTTIITPSLKKNLVTLVDIMNHGHGTVAGLGTPTGPIVLT